MVHINQLGRRLAVGLLILVGAQSVCQCQVFVPVRHRPRNPPAAPPPICPHPADQHPVKLPKMAVRVKVALNDSFESRLLKSELTRNWVAKAGGGNYGQLAELQCQQFALRKYFLFEFDGEAPIGTKLPAIKIGSADWESLDKRIFRYSTLPLRSLCWYRDVAWLDSIGEWEQNEPGTWDERFYLWKSNVPQAPWLPEGQLPVCRGIKKSGERLGAGYTDDEDKGP